MAVIRPIALPVVTTVTAGDILILDGATVRSITAANFVLSMVNLTGPITSVGNATSIASQTGTGSKIVVDTSPTLVTPTLNTPTLVTPILGVATATSINKVAFTAPATGSTLTIPDGVTLTGPAVSGTAMTLGNAETVTGAKTFNSSKLILAGVTSGTTVLNSGGTAGSSVLTLPVATDTLVGKATTDTLTNKTLDSAGTGNVLKVSGVTVSAGQYPGETGTGSATAGNTGEYVESIIASGSALSLTTTVNKTVTSITLAAGDWDVSGNVSFASAGGVSITFVEASLSLTTNVVDQTIGRNAQLNQAANVPGAAPSHALPVGPVRFSLSGSTTIFLVASSTFTIGTMAGYGIIRARRVR